MASPRTIRVATRSSRLAMVQAEWVVAALSREYPRRRFQVVPTSTLGDRDRSVPIQELGQGVFVKELEAALMAGEADLAVHSLKDMTTRLPEGLALAGVPAREDPRDALVSAVAGGLAGLPPGATIGTGSLRRQAQLRLLRPDLVPVLLRGNVDTRVRATLEERRVDGAILAAAGLHRLGLRSRIAEYLDPGSFLPDIGQGALGIEARASDAEALEMARRVEDPATRAAVDAERAFLATVGWGCKAPVAAFASLSGGVLRMAALLASVDASRVVRDAIESRDLSPQEAGRALALRMLEAGGSGIVREVEASSPTVGRDG